jgi:hypothetical protein
MPVRWRYHDADGAETSGPDVGFDDQADAEEWLGREWQGLLDAGVHAVTLLNGDEELYGPMSLHPA